MNMPSLTVTVAEMVEALESFEYPAPRGKISWERNEPLQAIVDGWPNCFVSDEASRLGIRSDGSFTEIMRAYVEDELRPTS
jgi:hypothetical protein